MLQIQDQSLRPLTTAHLAQTMSLLTLSNLELREKVLAELDENPALELVDVRVCPTCQKKLNGARLCPQCSQILTGEQPIVFVSPRESIRPPRQHHYDEQPADREPAAPEDLAIHVLQQIAADLTGTERALAVYVLSSLDEKGFLQDPPALIAQATRQSLSQVQRVLDLIAHADPPGLATRGPREALLAQLDLVPHHPDQSLARRLIQEAFQELSKKDFAEIAQILGVSVGRVKQVMAFVQANLNPFPGHLFWGSGRNPQHGDPNVYHTPDIQISQQVADPDGPLVVEIFAAIAGWLRVNQSFRLALKSATADQQEEWAKHVERASLFVKCLQQRNNTMRRLMEILVHRQRVFVLQGDRHLLPMTRAQLADEIGVHESTISRAVANKAVALPNGRIVPLARFFDRSLSVRVRIKEIVRSESKPLTDQQIATILAREGINIARRTVAKYRALEGILPARLRSRQSPAAG